MPSCAHELRGALSKRGQHTNGGSSSDFGRFASGPRFPNGPPISFASRTAYLLARPCLPQISRRHSRQPGPEYRAESAPPRVCLLCPPQLCFDVKWKIRVRRGLGGNGGQTRCRNSARRLRHFRLPFRGVLVRRREEVVNSKIIVGTRILLSIPCACDTWN